MTMTQVYQGYRTPGGWSPPGGGGLARGVGEDLPLLLVLVLLQQRLAKATVYSSLGAYRTQTSPCGKYSVLTGETQLTHTHTLLLLHTSKA